MQQETYADVVEHILFYVKGIEKDIDIPTTANHIRNYLRDEKEKSGLTNKFFSKQFSDFYDKKGCLDRSVIEHYFSEKQWVFPSKEIYQEILQKTGFFQKDYDELKSEYEKLVYVFNHEDIRTWRNPRDKRQYNYDKQIFPNVWYFNNKQEMTEYQHPTIKPLKLIETIIKASSNKGDLVLDPFMGSGTTGVACQNLSRDFIGYEISPEYFKIAEKRIKRSNQPSEAPHRHECRRIRFALRSQSLSFP